MNILVCFKTVPNLDQLPPEYFMADDNLQVNTGFVQSMVNCYDESALEMARQLNENANGILQLTAITVGTDSADSTFKTLYALGYYKGVRLEAESDIRFAPEIVADAITGFTKAHPQQVILAGNQSPEGDNAQMPLMLAEQLGWPCITNVTELALKDDLLLVRSAVEGGTLEQLIHPPVVLCVGDAPSTYLKFPTLKDRMRLGKKPIEVYPLASFATKPLSSPLVQPQTLYKTTSRRKGLILQGDTPTEKATLLYHNYVKEIIEQL